MWRSLLDLFWPPLCAVCGEESPADIHPACLERLGDPVPAPQHPAAVHARFEDSPEWFRLLHAWKYSGRSGIADVVAAAMLQCPVPDLHRSVLVPMPDDPARRLERGYSPVADLARCLAGVAGARIDAGLLRRRGCARSQTTCPNDQDRFRNVSGLFAAGDLARWPVSCTLVLVDDQITSGATVMEAVAVLRSRLHPVRVWCAARAQRAPRRCLDALSARH